MSDKYILDHENRPVQTDDLEAWLDMHSDMNKRRVAWDEVGGANVSTVFLGLDHRFGDPGPPLLFETMVFPYGDGEDSECHRYSSWDDALTGHQAVVRRLREQAGEADDLLGKMKGRS